LRPTVFGRLAGVDLKMGWFGVVRVTGNIAIRQIAYEFLLVFRCKFLCP